VKNKVYINFKKFYKNGDFRITLAFGKKLFDFNFFAKWNNFVGALYKTHLNQKHLILNKKVTIIWSGDEKLLSIYLLTKEERNKFGVFGYTNHYIKIFHKIYSYRIKYEGVETTNMISLLGLPDKHLPEKLHYKFLSESIAWRKRLIEKPLYEGTNPRLLSEINFIELLRIVKIRNL
jgi:hypothetical protein